jgi:hypothetical protein
MATVIISTIENKHPVFVYQLTPAAEVGEARQGYIGLLNNPTALFVVPSDSGFVGSFQRGRCT